jgi:DNA-binding MarR family transcriptional regulator
MLPTVCACNKLRRSARIISAIYDQALKPCGISVAQYSLLRMLQRAGPSSLTRLADATGHDRTTLNRTLKPLEKAGLVSSSSGADQRARIASVTPKGDELIREGEPHWEKAQMLIEKKLGPERASLFAILDRIEELRG